MELDYIADINEYGENVVRLYNFDKSQAIKLRELINDIVVNKNQKLDLSQVDFIKSRNCNLVLGQYKSDEGIISVDDKTFYCALTLAGYQNIVKLLAPFCVKESRAHQYLYDIDNPTDFLFCPAGTW
jgi:hypothetical protein